jgi:hypothetical protein
MCHVVGRVAASATSASVSSERWAPLAPSACAPAFSVLAISWRRVGVELDVRGEVAEHKCAGNNDEIRTAVDEGATDPVARRVGSRKSVG